MLYSSAASSCICCIDPSYKLQGDLHTDLSYGEPGMSCNGIRDEQITPEIVNKAFIKKSKTFKFKNALPVLQSPALGF